MSTPSDRLTDIAHEADYWRLALDDVLGVNTLIGTAAETLSEVTVSLLSASQAPHEHALGFVADGMDAVSATMRHLQQMQTKVISLTELVSGRLKVLEAAVAELGRIG